MRLVLDTNALWSQELIRELSAARAAGMRTPDGLDVILPVIAYVERSRQVQGDPPRQGAWERVQEQIVPKIEPFRTGEAENVLAREPDRPDWDEHGRDYLIAAHVHGDRVGVTEDQGPAWDDVDHLTPDQAADLVAAMLG